MKEEKKIDILFVIPPYHHRNGSGFFFPLGISSIIACLEMRNLTWDYIDCVEIVRTLTNNSLKQLEIKLEDKLKKYHPQIVGIGPCVTPGARALKVVSDCCVNAFGVDNVFAGGPFVNLPSQGWFFYEYLGLKYLIKGEGEIAVCEAVETIKSGQGLDRCREVSKHNHEYMNYIENLDDLPFPRRVQIEKNKLSDRRRSDNKGDIVAQIVASRGCPYKCTYCVSGNMKAVSFRKRSAKNIISEIKMLVEQYGVTDIVFYDDCFFTGKNTIHKEIKNFCSAMIEADVKVTWQIEMRPDIITEITNEELLFLEKCGCRQMNIGLERTDVNGADLFGKPYDLEGLRLFIMHIHDVCQIKIAGTFILGGKSETEATVRNMINTSIQLGIDKAEYSPLFVYPDTPLYGEVFSNPKEWFDIVKSANEPWGEVVYETESLTKEKLQQLVDEAYHAFYGDTEFDVTNHIKDRYQLK